MKTLAAIQKLTKLGRVLSKIVFIFSLIGAIACVAGVISMALLPESFQLGSVTIKGLVDLTDEINPNEVYAAMVAGMITFTAEAVLAKLAERYFRHELEAGTPFTFAGAKELKRLGICAIVLPIAALAAAEIVYNVMQQFMSGIGSLDLAESGSVGLGIMMIVASLLCKYGAELTQARAE